jgi:hypothetical protein
MKGLIYLGIGVGGAIGSYVPALFGQDMFSVASIIGGGDILINTGKSSTVKILKMTAV